MFECITCKLKYACLNNNFCEFCNIIKDNKKSDIYNILICFSKLNQLEIIKKTYEYFIKNDRIPTPEEIDQNCKKIKVNPYLFRTYINNNKYVIFFTNCIDRNKLKTKKISNKYKIEKINIDKFYNDIDLEFFDKKTYNEYTHKIGL